MSFCLKLVSARDISELRSDCAPVCPPPSLSPSLSLSLSLSLTLPLSSDAEDADRPPDRLEFLVSAATACGQVTLTSDPSSPVTSFTRDQLVAGQVAVGSVSYGKQTVADHH